MSQPTTASPPASRRAGRPRNDATRPRVLEAARRLVLSNGYAGVSIGAIAGAAGVARQTLYRRWPGKAELVLDAFLASVDAVRGDAAGPIAVRLCHYLGALFENLQEDGRAIRSLIASAQEDPAFLVTFRVHFVQARVTIVRRMLEQAVADCELPRDADVESAVEMIHGAFWYRLLQEEVLDRAQAARIAAAALRSLRGGDGLGAVAEPP